MNTFNLLKIVGFFFCFFISFYSCKNEERTYSNLFTIEGEIDGLEGNLYYRHPERQYSREHPSDSVIVEGNKFKLTDSVSEIRYLKLEASYDPKLIRYNKNGGYYPSKSMWLMVFIYPDAEIRVEGEVTDFMNVYPEGDKHNEDFASLNRVVYPLYNQSVMYSAESTYLSDSSKIEELQFRADSLRTLALNEQEEFIRKNPGSVAAHWYLNDMMLRIQIEDDESTELFGEMPTDFQNFYYKSVESRVKGIEATKEGKPVPEINTLATLNGEKFDINSYKGKYVLIDFWGTWCAPCIAEMPEIKELQEKYKDDLRVLGINVGDNKEQIELFVEKHGYDWQQVLSDKADTSDNFQLRFNVKGFPTKFIIDREGKIVKRLQGSGEEAFALLEELINQKKSS